MMKFTKLFFLGVFVLMAWGLQANSTVTHAIYVEGILPVSVYVSNYSISMGEKYTCLVDPDTTIFCGVKNTSLGGAYTNDPQDFGAYQGERVTNHKKIIQNTLGKNGSPGLTCEIERLRKVFFDVETTKTITFSGDEDCWSDGRENGTYEDESTPKLNIDYGTRKGNISYVSTDIEETQTIERSIGESSVTKLKAYRGNSGPDFRYSFLLSAGASKINVTQQTSTNPDFPGHTIHSPIFRATPIPCQQLEVMGTRLTVGCVIRITLQDFDEYDVTVNPSDGVSFDMYEYYVSVSQRSEVITAVNQRLTNLAYIPNTNAVVISGIGFSVLGDDLGGNFVEISDSSSVFQVGPIYSTDGTTLIVNLPEDIGSGPYMFKVVAGPSSDWSNTMVLGDVNTNTQATEVYSYNDNIYGGQPVAVSGSGFSQYGNTVTLERGTTTLAVSNIPSNIDGNKIIFILPKEASRYIVNDGVNIVAPYDTYYLKVTSQNGASSSLVPFRVLTYSVGTNGAITRQVQYSSVRASQLPEMPKSLSVVSGKNGIILSYGGEIYCGNRCKYMLPVGKENLLVNMIAIPKSGYRFNGWDGECHGDLSCQLNLSRYHLVTSGFVEGDNAMSIDNVSPNEIKAGGNLVIKGTNIKNSENKVILINKDSGSIYNLFIKNINSKDYIDVLSTSIPSSVPNGSYIIAVVSKNGIVSNYYDLKVRSIAGYFTNISASTVNSIQNTWLFKKITENN